MKKKEYRAPQLELLGSAASMTAFENGWGRGFGSGKSHKGNKRIPGFDELS